MKNITHVHLLRHGETQGGTRFNGSNNVLLSEHGWSQMQAAVENEDNWSRIISSPLSRCIDFSQTLSHQRNIHLQLDRRIKEIHFGIWEGKTAAEIMADDEKALTRFWQNPTQDTPVNGESLTDFEARVLSFWQEIMMAYQGENILLVTHGGVIRLLLCHILQRSLQYMLEIQVAYATIHRIRIEHSQRAFTAFIETEI